MSTSAKKICKERSRSPLKKIVSNEISPKTPKSHVKRVLSDNDDLLSSTISPLKRMRISTIQSEELSPKKPVNSPTRPVNSPKKPVNSPKRPVNSPKKPLTSPTKSVNSPRKPINSPKKKGDSKFESKQYFYLACQSVCSEVFYDSPLRLGLKDAPDCYKNKSDCKNLHNKKELLPFQVLSYEQEAFRIRFKSGMWYEALCVCKDILKYNKFPTVEIMLNVTAIILNIYDSEDSQYSSAYLIQESLSTIDCVFATHPPCTAPVRTFYKEFLINSFKRDSAPKKNKAEPQQSIFKFVINRIEAEIQSDIPEGPAIDRSDLDPGLSDADLFNYFYLHKMLDRKMRISRLMMVLEYLVELLEADLCIFHEKHIKNPSKHMMKQSKPLIGWLLWSSNVLCTGMVNDACRQIFRLLVELVKLDFPKKHVTLLSRLVSVMAYAFYMCERESNTSYPNVGKHCHMFAKEMFKSILGEDVNTQVKIIAALQPSFLQHLISFSALKHLLKMDEDFMTLTLKIFQQQLWNNFREPYSTDMPTCLRDLTKHKENAYENSKNVYLDILKNLSSVESQNLDSKLEYQRLSETLSPVKARRFVDSNQFISLFYLTFSAYLDAFNIEKIQARYEALINKNACLTMDDVSNSVFQLDKETVRMYIKIFRVFKEIVALYASERKRNHSLKIFENIKILQTN